MLSILFKIKRHLKIGAFVRKLRRKNHTPHCVFLKRNVFSAYTIQLIAQLIYHGKEKITSL